MTAAPRAASQTCRETRAFPGDASNSCLTFEGAPGNASLSRQEWSAVLGKAPISCLTFAAAPRKALNSSLTIAADLERRGLGELRAPTNHGRRRAISLISECAACEATLHRTGAPC